MGLDREHMGARKVQMENQGAGADIRAGVDDQRLWHGVVKRAQFELPPEP